MVRSDFETFPAKAGRSPRVNLVSCQMVDGSGVARDHNVFFGRVHRNSGNLSSLHFEMHCAITSELYEYHKTEEK